MPVIGHMEVLPAVLRDGRAVSVFGPVNPRKEDVLQQTLTRNGRASEAKEQLARDFKVGGYRYQRRPDWWYYANGLTPPGRPRKRRG